MQRPSSLTREVFRALLADRPYAFAGCRRQATRRSMPYLFYASQFYNQKRSIFGGLLGATQPSLAAAKITPSNLDVALGQLVDLVRARRTQSKPPEQDQVLDAFRFLIRSHLEHPRRITRNEVYIATETFKHLQELALVAGGEGQPAISRDDLTAVLHVLARAGGKEKFRSDTGALAHRIFEQLRTLPNKTPVEEGEILVKEDVPLGVYVEILSSTGRAREARDMLWESPQAQQRDFMPAWVAVVKGLFNEGLDKEAWRTLEQIQDSIGLLDLSEQESLILFLVNKSNILAAKKVYELRTESDEFPSIASKISLIQLCARKKDFDWSGSLVESILSTRDNTEVRNTVLLWHVAQNSNASSIDRGLDAGLKALDIFRASLTMENINYLLEYAYVTRNPDAARVLMDIATQADLKPDAKTFLAQFAYQVDTGDIPAAANSYELLSSEDLLSDGSDIPVLNKFLTALCFSQKPDMETIMRVVDGLLDRGADLEAETVAGLCHVFLQRDETAQAMGLLRHRTDFYPEADRVRISAIFQSFILDPTVEDHRGFNAYELYRHAFPETPVQERMLLMKSFFDRNRSDLACLVFGHMRQREELEARPTPEAYAQCFEGIAQSRDVDGLQMVYNMLKMDREVEQTTRIHNALMAAYTACQMPFTAIIDHFWKIMDSREGPTMSSFALALRACETWIPQGSQEARRVIALMQGYGFEISKEIYHCYIGALAGQSEFETTIELIEEMENDIGEKPDAITIGTFYNAIPWQYRKDEVETWAKQAFPDLWEELVAYGDVIDEEWEVRYFKIDRTIDIDDEPLFGEGEYNPKISHAAQMMLESPLK